MKSQPNLTDVLATSTQALNAYHQLLAKEQPSKPKTEDFDRIAKKLTETRDELKKGIRDGRMTHVAPETRNQMVTAINSLLNDKTTVDKMAAVRIAIYAANTPFLEVLRNIQELLRTVEGLKTARGGRAAPIGDMDVL